MGERKTPCLGFSVSSQKSRHDMVQFRQDRIYRIGSISHGDVIRCQPSINASLHLMPGHLM